MKNILGVIFSKNGKEEQTEIVGKAFVVRTLDPKISDEIHKQQDEIEQLQQKAELPFWFRIVQMASMLLCIVLLFVYSKFKDADWSIAFIIAAVVILVCFAVSSLIAKRREKAKKIELDQKAEKILPRINATWRKAKRDMCIPDSAKEVDVLMQKYVVGADGNLKDKGLLVADFASLSEFIYVKGTNFIISGIDMALSIPLDSVKKIRKIDKTATFMGWNKRNPHSSPEFAKYAIKRNRYDVYSVKPYYELVIEDENCSGVIKFPVYELNEFVKLLHVEIEEIDEKTDKNQEKTEK